MGRLHLATVALLLASCSKGASLEVRFRSAAMRAVSTDVQVFVFDTPSGDAPGCEILDPRGLGPGNAADRTGLTPSFFRSGPLEDEIARIPDLAAGPHTVVIEAWGPTCESVSGGNEPSCSRLASRGPNVLRGYWCNVLDLDPSVGLDLAADLQSFALIGATMSVPDNFAEAIHYDAEHPLRVADGSPGGDPFLVQLIDHEATEVDGALVRFSVVSGPGAIVEPQPVASATDDIIQDSGLASSTVRANFAAAAAEDTRIVVSAYAPGYEGAPVLFEARPVPSVDVTIDILPVPRSVADLGDTNLTAQPVVVGDLNGDDRLDVITVAGFSDHRMVAAYGRPNGWSVHHSPPRPLQARAIALARLRPNVTTVIVSAAEYVGVDRNTPFGRTFGVVSPQLELWDGFSELPLTPLVSTPPTIVDRIDGQPIQKVAIAIDAANLDGDPQGIDELAMTRCSFLWQEGGRQLSNVLCFGRLIDKTDSEVAVLTVATSSVPRFSTAAVIPGEGNDGGYREVRFVDIDGDTSLDLVATTDTTVVGVCGARNQPATGFGFGVNPRFSETTTFSSAYSLAFGRFDGDSRTDLLASGGVRAGSTEAGFKLIFGGPCDFASGPKPIIVGPKSASYLLSVRAADLNGDGWTDVITLHRDTRKLVVHFGGGNGDFAAGPIIDLPTGTTGELGLGVEEVNGVRTVVAATVDRAESAFVIVRFRAR